MCVCVCACLLACVRVKERDRESYIRTVQVWVTRQLCNSVLFLLAFQTAGVINVQLSKDFVTLAVSSDTLFMRIRHSL